MCSKLRKQHASLPSNTLYFSSLRRCKQAVPRLVVCLTRVIAAPGLLRHCIKAEVTERSTAFCTNYCTKGPFINRNVTNHRPRAVVSASERNHFHKKHRKMKTSYLCKFNYLAHTVAIWHSYKASSAGPD